MKISRRNFLGAAAFVAPTAWMRNARALTVPKLIEPITLPLNVSADYSATLKAALLAGNRLSRPVDGRGQTYTFMQAGGSGSGPLAFTGLTGLLHLRNCILDFSACISDAYLLSISGPEPTTPVALTADAAVYSTTISVANTASFVPGRYVVINSQGVWITAPSNTTTMNEYNRVFSRSTASGAGTVTLESPLLNNYLVSDDAVLLGLYPTSATTWEGLKFIGDEVTIIGAGNVISQTGLYLRNTLNTELRTTANNCYSFGVELSQFNIGANVKWHEGIDCNNPSLGYALGVDGSYQTEIGHVIGHRCSQTASFGSASSTIGGKVFGIIGRTTHVDSVFSTGGYHTGGAVNSHPSTAGLEVEYVEGTAQLNASDGRFIVLNGVNQSIKRILCNYSAGHVVLLQYCGGRDAAGPATYDIGEIIVGAAGSIGNVLVISGTSESVDSKLDNVGVGRIVTGAACHAGVAIDSQHGPVGIVDIGPSIITPTGDNALGIFVPATAGYTIDKVQARGSTLKGNAAPGRAVNCNVDASASTPPVMILTDCNIIGGGADYAIYNNIAAQVYLRGHSIITGITTTAFYVANAPLISVLGSDAPPDKWSPTSSSSYVMPLDVVQIDPDAAGYTLTITIPPGFRVGQRFEVHMKANGGNMSWISPDGKAMNGFSTSLSPYTRMVAEFNAIGSGTGEWNRISNG